MGNGSRAGSRRKRSKPIRWFYLNGELHQKLHVNRATDLVTAWSYPQEKRVTYLWSYTKRQMQQAFSRKQVAQIFQRHPMQIDKYVREGHVRTPQRTYSLNGSKSPGKFMWSEDDLLALHDYLSTVHYGRPRNDGMVNPTRLISKAELKAILRNDTVLYVKDEESGEFRPTWKEVDW